MLLIVTLDFETLNYEQHYNKPHYKPQKQYFSIEIVYDELMWSVLKYRLTNS